MDQENHDSASQALRTLAQRVRTTTTDIWYRFYDRAGPSPPPGFDSWRDTDGDVAYCVTCGAEAVAAAHTSWTVDRGCPNDDCPATWAIGFRNNAFTRLGVAIFTALLGYALTGAAVLGWIFVALTVVALDPRGMVSRNVHDMLPERYRQRDE